MERSDIEALLGRPLTSTESNNFDLYLDIAKESLEALLCMSLEETTELQTRTYRSRNGYKTLFTDVFQSVSAVEVDGTAESADNYTVMQWDKYNGSWYNSLVFSSALQDDEIEVTGIWGFSEYPSDLKLLWAKLFSQVSVKNTGAGNITSKQVEDFRITFNDSVTADQQLASDYASTIEKYGLCGVGNIQHGDVCYGRVLRIR